MTDKTDVCEHGWLAKPHGGIPCPYCFGVLDAETELKTELNDALHTIEQMQTSEDNALAQIERLQKALQGLVDGIERVGDWDEDMRVGKALIAAHAALGK